MKKLSKLLVLVGVLGVTAWLGGSRSAYALFTCEYLQGRACSPEGATKVCVYEGTPYTGVCECWGGHWFC
jgi:hypothetical protein